MAILVDKLAYLLSPDFQIESVAGKPLVGGHIEVFLAGTNTKYITCSDWDGGNHPFKIPLKNDGRNVILAEVGNHYDYYVYDSYGNLAFSRLNVVPIIGGNINLKGRKYVTIGNSDGTLDISVNAASTSVDHYNIDTKHSQFGVQSPLHFVEDTAESTVIGLDDTEIKELVKELVTSAASGFANKEYVDNSVGTEANTRAAEDTQLGNRITSVQEYILSHEPVWEKDTTYSGISPVIVNNTNHTISISGDIGQSYSAGPNINITDHIISGKSWQNEIAVATEGKADLSAIYDLSAGDNITIVQSGDGYVINSTGGGSEYSAGSNINITDNVISGKDWTDDISVATEGKADLSAIYDLSAGDNITIVQSGDGYVINSTGGGSEIPSALSGRWEDTSDTVETMSGAWGGSALPVSAGPGIKVELVDDKLVFSNDETVLWENVNGVAPGGTTKIGTLSEPLSNFKTYAIDVSFENLYPWKRNVFDVPHNWSSATNVPGVYFMGVTHANSLKPQESNALYDSFNTFGIGENMSDFYSLGSKVFNNGSVMPSVTGLSYVYKVVGINRIAGGN